MKALVLHSGGLDSRLTIKLLQDQGIEVEAVHFKLPFEGCCQSDCAFKFAQLEGIKLYIMDVTKGRLFKDYIRMLRKPSHGHGSGLNPCIDCRIFMLKRAKNLAKEISADIIATGEVLDERPMSQTMKSMKIIEKEAGLEGKLLRPLSAKVLPETKAEKRGWVDRSKLMNIQGRRRLPQLELAKKFEIRSFPNPAGGCILCEKEFAAKLRDLLSHKKNIEPEDIRLLRIGRHFRFGGSKIIVGRKELENELLKTLKASSDYVFEVPNIGSPNTILTGKKTPDSIKIASALTARYSDTKEKEVLVRYGKEKLTREIIVKIPSEKTINDLMIISHPRDKSHRIRPQSEYKRGDKGDKL